MSRNIVCYFM